jgi:hypothetical protein
MTNHHLPIPSNISSNYEASSSNVRTRRGTINGKEYEFIPDLKKKVYSCRVGTLRPPKNTVDQEPAQNAITQKPIFPRYLFTATFGTLQQVGEDEKQQIAFTKLVPIPTEIFALIARYLSFEQTLNIALEETNYGLFFDRCIFSGCELNIDKPSLTQGNLLSTFSTAKTDGVPYKITSININRVPYGGERPTDQTLNAISKLFPNLEKIRFNLTSDYYFTVRGFEGLLKNCPHLRTMKVPKALSLKNQDLTRLFNKYSTPSRQLFDLHWCCTRTQVHEALTIFEQERADAIQNTPTSMNLNLCSDLTNDDLLRIVRLFRDLQSIDLSGCELISNKSLEKLRAHCPQLHTIRLSNCKNVTDAAITNLFRQYGSQLRLLDVSYCPQVSSNGLPKDSTQRRDLETLRFANSWTNSDSGISDKEDLTIIAYQLPNLRVLDIQWREITKENLSVIAEQCEKLHTIYVHGCSPMTPQDLRELSRSYPRIHFNSEEQPMYTRSDSTYEIAQRAWRDSPKNQTTPK